MNYLIITADDYGACEYIDAGIEKAIQNQWITAVAVLPNGNEEDFQRVIRLHEEYGDKVDIGCHFNITNGKPLLPWPERFTRKYKKERLFEWILDVKLMELDTQLLEDELHAQVDRFESHNIPIKHFSDHFGVLSVMEGSVCATMCRVIKSYNERNNTQLPVRNPILSSVLAERGTCLRNSTLRDLGRFANFVRKLKLVATDENAFQLFYDNMKERLEQIRGFDFRHTDYFLDQYFKINESNAAETINCLNDHQLVDQKAELPSNMSEDPVFELVIHPGEDPEKMQVTRKKLRYYKRYWRFNRKLLKKERPTELAYLPELVARINDNEKFTITTFHEMDIKRSNEGSL